jgi:uncharacterized Ntn-hydrolase superfamily protein
MTYSIVARDPSTGRFGVAVQSHALDVGRSVAWAEAGVGAVATQARSNVSFGPIGLELLRNGRTADETLAALIASDRNSAERQVGIVDRSGKAASFTGDACIPAAGHHLGSGYALQGNLLENESCLPAMASAYDTTVTASLPFSECLLRALEAAEDEGGDVRGRQSAAIKVVAADPHPAPWRGIILDLRVVDHENPLVELRRLVRLVETHALLDEDGDAASSGSGRLARYAEARERNPEAVGLAFRIGVELANAGDLDGAKRELAHAFAADPRWRTTLERYARAGRLVDPTVLESLLGTDSEPGDGRSTGNN